MNQRIRGLFIVLAVGFATLITMTAYWQIWAADSLAARADNARLVYRQLQIKRGLIFASNGRTVLAQNRSSQHDGITEYTRVYPPNGLFAHVVGYNTVDQGRSGVELSYNDYLTASNASLATELRNLGDTLRGRTVTGDNLVTSLSVPAQLAAQKGMLGHVGAVVALEPSTGRVLAMYSNPTFNPNYVVQRFPYLNRPGGNAPLLNRATQGLYPPGSTFKTVTATAALDSGLYNPESTINAFGSCIEPTQFPIFAQLCNASDESFGTISLTTAFTYSVNTVFAQIGLKLGHARLVDYMRRFGFWSLPPMDYPGNEMSPSGLYTQGHLLLPSKPMDVARVAIGQERLLATPLQMAEVAATVANGGIRMRPTLVDRAVEPGGSVVYTNHPQQIQRVMSPVTAQELTEMMRKVVDEGTGTAAQIGNLPVAGKTGTAELAPNVNDAWFIAFAPADHPQIAIAVIIERTPLYGGQVAAPIAADVIRAYLNKNLAQ